MIYFFVVSAIIFTFIFLAMAFIIIGIISTLIIRIPYVNTPRDYIKKITPELEIAKDSVVYDLGCGNGDFLLEALKFNPKKCIGYEISPVAFICAMYNTFFKGGSKIYIRFENFFKADISKADIIYLYLIPRAIIPLQEKFKKELKSGARFVCVGSNMPDFKPYKEIVLKGDYRAYLYQN